MSNRSSRDRIPSGDLTAYERWELPLLDEEGGRKPGMTQAEEDVKPLTAEDLEAIHNEAYQDGYNEGFELGKKEGMDQGAREGYRLGEEEGRAAGRETGHQQALDETRQAMEQKQNQLDQLMESLVKPIDQQRDSVEAATLNLVMALSRAVIQRELSMDSSQIRALVHDALDILPGADEQVRISVNPEDAEAVREAVTHHDARTRVIENERVHPGGCKVENSQSLVDFTVEKRFQKVVQSMLDQQLSDDDSGEHSELDAMMGELSDYHRDVLEETPEQIRNQEPEPESERSEAVADPEAEPRKPDDGPEAEPDAEHQGSQHSGDEEDGDDGTG